LWICAVAVGLFLAARPTCGQSTPDSKPTAADDDCGQLLLGTPNERTSTFVANLVRGTDPAGRETRACDLIRKLGAMTEPDRCIAQATNALILRQELTDMILTASLQVDGFLTEIDNEAGHIRAVHDGLADRRDSTVNRSSLGSAAGTGGGAIGSALALVGGAASTAAGNWLSATFGGLGAAFSFWGYFKANGPKGCFPDVQGTPCQKPNAQVVSCEDPKNHPGGCSPTMLYHLLLSKDNDKKIGFHSDYDPLIERYLETGWRQKLIAEWQWDEKNPNYALIAGNSDPRKLSIDRLTDRANKLAELRGVASFIKFDLSLLMTDLSPRLVCPLP
jgi:hypothetical protein